MARLRGVGVLTRLEWPLGAEKDCSVQTLEYITGLLLPSIHQEKQDLLNKVPCLPPHAFWGYNPVCKVTPIFLNGVVSTVLTI